MWSLNYRPFEVQSWSSILRATGTLCLIKPIQYNQNSVLLNWKLLKFGHIKKIPNCSMINVFIISYAVHIFCVPIQSQVLRSLPSKTPTVYHLIPLKACTRALANSVFKGTTHEMYSLAYCRCFIYTQFCKEDFTFTWYNYKPVWDDLPICQHCVLNYQPF